MPASDAARRPIPYPVVPPAGYQRAVQRGTRLASGAPGPRYWQQWASYRVDVRVDPGAKSLSGTERVMYHNRSPDTLPALVMHLHQNLYAPGSVRNEEVEVTGGVQLGRVAVGGQVLTAGDGEGPGYSVEGTRLELRPARPLLPGDSVAIETAWSFKIPQSGSGRMGWDGDDMLFLAYFYPQMAVYDDVVGWQADPYMSSAEFYMGYGDYELTVDAPAGWTVVATGELQNAAEVMPPAVLARLRRAEASDSVVHVLSPQDFGAGRATLAGTDGRLRWRWRAGNVRDVAFSLTRASRWDAGRTLVGDRDGDGRADYARVDALWRATAPRWANAARDGQHSIAHLSRYTGYPYPWSHMTSVEGGAMIGGGMEYPMMTLIGPYTERSDTALYGVIVHEFAHMWVPMIVGTDENRYGWMDEGTTDFNEAQALNAEYAGAPDAHVAEQTRYLALAKRGYDTDLMRWTNFQYPGAYGLMASYYKPATAMAALRGVIGEEAFNRGLRKFVRDWAFKHPYPWDFFHAFDQAAGRDLGWFWRTWYYEEWLLDQSVRSVTAGPGGTAIVVEDRGNAPMPARLTVTRANGRVEHAEVPVETWLSGARTATVNVPAGDSPVVRVEIDAEHAFPDANRTNNVWTRATAPATR
ncbi:MAG TPA: M1 family metallopeptidase [Longimicrobiaceae bacterium]|nr:M1 family metallopeptidase [Longimicrobiaceae bacterium]